MCLLLAVERMEVQPRAGAGIEHTADAVLVQLPDELISARKRWRLRCPKGEPELVFPDAKGRPIQSSDLLRTGLHSSLRRAGLHHANVHITLVTYAHAIPKARSGRCVGSSHCAEWKQNGNIESGSGLRGLIE